MLIHYKSLLLIPFHSGRNISYRHEDRYHNTPHSTSNQISAYFGVFWPFRPISAEIHISPVPDFGLKKKKKKKKNLTSSSSSSSSGFRTHLLLSFLQVGFGPANLLFVFYLSVFLPPYSSLNAMYFVLNFLFVLLAHVILFSLVTRVLKFELFLCYVFVSPTRLTIKIECFSLNRVVCLQALHYLVLIYECLIL